MRELSIHGITVRLFENNIVKIYANSQSEADKIWEYLLQENLV